MLNFTYNIYIIITEIYILISTCALILFGVFYSTNIYKGYPILTNLFNFFSIQITINSLILILNQHPLLIKSWNNFIQNDLMTYNLKIILLITFLVYCIIINYYNNYININSFEFWILILISLIAFFFIVQVNDFLLLYLVIEFQSLIFYILASFNRTSEFSTEAGLKYFVLGAFSSALLLFGMSIIYGLTGVTNLTDFIILFLNINTKYLNIVQEVSIGIIFITIALLFKLSAAPFHMWAPDVYEGSPTSVTAFFSIISKIIILSLLIKLLILTFYDFINVWRNILLFSIVCSSIIGTLSAFKQVKWKRFIAYSSINHISFWLLALYTGDLAGCVSLYFYLFIYLVMLISIFIILLNIQIFKYPNKIQIRYFDSFSSLVYINPLLAIILTLLLFSMAGIPPMAGFFAKFIILFTAIKSNIHSLIIFIILLNCLACFYYLRLIKIIYFDTIPKFNVLSQINKSSALLLSLITFLIMFIFLDFELVFIIINLITKPFFI